MSYELQVYALSPVRPSPREILARAGESGLAVGMTPAPGAAAGLDDHAWTRLLLRSEEAAQGGYLVEASTELARMQQALREDREQGEEVPDQVLEARQLYVLELDDEAPAGEEHQAAFVVSAWALASLTEAIVFDPQEEFFADADSFWALLMDESMADDEDGLDGDDDADDETEGAPGDADGHGHHGACCGGGPDEDHGTQGGMRRLTVLDGGRSGRRRPGAAETEPGDPS